VPRGSDSGCGIRDSWDSCARRITANPGSRIPNPVWIAAALLLIAATAFAQRGFGGFSDFGGRFVPFRIEPNAHYDGRFTFVRVRYEMGMGYGGRMRRGLDLKWNHDYPRAEAHFTKILKEITTIDPNVGTGNIVALDDPDLFRYPVAYVCEPGFLTLNDEETAALRAYLLKGGFMIVDDFAGRQWSNFAAQMARVLPRHRLIEVDNSHAVFDSFFRVEDPRAFPHPYFRVPSNYFGVFEDNDPNKRLMMIVNYNQDVSEYWEWSDTSYMPIDLNNEAYKLGVDYVIYGMTH